MDLARLIDALSQPAAYPHSVQSVEVRQTHISAVFLAGEFVYKIKKPVTFGFVDFSTLERRRHFCEEEVRLNRRLAPDVYLGVVPVTQDGGQVRLENSGEAIEWAVKMRRLPEEATLDWRLQHGGVDLTVVEEFARRLAQFHQASAATPVPTECGRFTTVAENLGNIFTQSLAQVDRTVSRPVFERLRVLMDQSLERFRTLIESRAARGMTRDTHGDLHLDHIYWFPNQTPPADLVVVDCIEFNERFRYIDPIADMAFPYMDFVFHGRGDLAECFAAEYFRASGDAEGRFLLPLYSAYRAAVRGSVAGLKLAESEVSEADSAEEFQKSRGHWLLALGELEQRTGRPCLVLVGGLPGTGKSTLARQLAARANFCWIRSDAIRKELAGVPADKPASSEVKAELYGREWTERTYAVCLRRAEELLFEGKRVLVDATFRDEQRRRIFLSVARAWGVPALLLLCQAEPSAVQRRLGARHADVSDADWQIYLQLRSCWEESSDDTRRYVRKLPTAGDPEATVASACRILEETSLFAESAASAH